jgi:acyl dehydratase
MPIDGYSLRTLGHFVGQELGVSDWITVDQARIDQFADQTGDHQWIHVDVERARRESRMGSTIAHGYLTLALAAAWQLEIGIVPAGVSEALNYGTDRVRFLSPVKAGARIRDRVALLEVQPKDDGNLVLKTRNTIEIEGETRPALIADTLSLLVVNAAAHEGPRTKHELSI